jgi:protein-S-isoprenylcysteine O-methyltransferase Ste14
LRSQAWIGWRSSPPFLGIFIVPALDRRAGRSLQSPAIETAEGQRVVSTGPYAIVRHPMYAGALLMLLGTPLALGSVRGVVPFAFMVVIIVVRLLDEERFLTRGLPGYAAYRERVRSRLVPYLW